MSNFQSKSRELAAQAQQREAAVDQPKEHTIGEKATITLTNLLGGEYYWTVDEYCILDDCLFLIEKKHSKKKCVPSAYDIKDAFIKMALFSNIRELQYNGATIQNYAAVGLTSDHVKGVLHSNMKQSEIDRFLSENHISAKDGSFLISAINEARTNGFGLFLLNAQEEENQQQDILAQLPR